MKSLISKFRIVLALILTMSFTLTVAPRALAEQPPAGDISPFAWDPATNGYANGNIDGYVEGEVAAVIYHLRNLAAGTYDVWVCLETVANNGSYGFVDFGSSWIQTHTPPYLPSANGGNSGVPVDPNDPNWSKKANANGAGIWGYNITINSVGPTTRGTNTQVDCPVGNFIGVAVNFTSNGAHSNAWIAWGARFALVGDPLPAVTPPFSDLTVPSGKSASTVNGTIQTHIGPKNDKTINFMTAEAAPDLVLMKFCPDWTASQTFGITVTNNSSTTTSQNLTLQDTLQYGLTVANITSTPVAACSYEDIDPDPGRVQHKVTCTLSSLTAGATWQVQIMVNVDPVIIPLGSPVRNEASVTSTTPDPNLVNNSYVCSSSTPVTLASFLVTRSGEGLRFEWSTATEVGNVGFNLYAQTPSGRERINAQLIPSAAPDSITPQNYVFEVQGLEAETFYLEDVDVTTFGRLHGPFALGEVYGGPAEVDAIDWQAIRAEHQEKVDLRASQAGGETAQQSLAAADPGLVAAAQNKVYMPLLFLPPKAGSTYPVVTLMVEQDGLYRITYEQLHAAGFDWLGAAPYEIALTNQGIPLPIYVHGSLYFGPGDYIEFYGRALDSLYTHTNVYTLLVDADKALRVATETAIPQEGVQPASYYLETVTVENNKHYSVAAPNGDPWYDTDMLAYTEAKTWSFDIAVEGYLPGVAPVTLFVGIWGVTDWPQVPDHHVIARFNGSIVADETFNGNINRPINALLPEGLLQEGVNTLELTLPGDTGVDWDIVNLDKYAVTYPRAFISTGGRLQFTSSASAFLVDGLPSPDVVVYRLDAGAAVKLDGVQVTPTAEGYSAAFAGTGMPASYAVYAAPALLAPAVQAARRHVDITSGAVDYLVISHPDFLADLAPLVLARQAQGLSVRVVDVEDIYSQFGYGIFGPSAIRNYIAYAARNMGTQYVLLVGGDTYDYFDYEGTGSLSFLPSLYAPTDSLVKFAPVDPLYADINGDRLPDLALGRFPVRTSAELATLIQKTLAYDLKDYAGSAVFAADSFDGVNDFQGDSNLFAQQLPADWSVTKAYLDELGLDAARAALLDALNGGVSLANFVGHSSMSKWTFKGLFSTVDAASLINAGKPAVVVQWGCWNTYYVAPSYNTLGHILLLSGDRGAAAVLGASTLTLATSEAMLGKLLTAKLAQPGMTIGQAMLTAKLQLAQQKYLADVILGWTLLGDPALVIQP